MEAGWTTSKGLLLLWLEVSTFEAGAARVTDYIGGNRDPDNQTSNTNRNYRCPGAPRSRLVRSNRIPPTRRTLLNDIQTETCRDSHDFLVSPLKRECRSSAAPGSRLAQPRELASRRLRRSANARMRPENSLGFSSTRRSGIDAHHGRRRS